MKPTSILALLFVLCLVGCSTSKSAESEAATPVTETTEAVEPSGESASAEPTQTAETAPQDVMPNDGTRQVGDVTRCPVSGDVFTVAADSPKAEHDGGTYYLCCKGCVDKFAADPAKFLSASSETPSAHEHGAHHEGHTH